MRTVVVHRCADRNIGDRSSSPALYFDLGEVETVDVTRVDWDCAESVDVDLLVIGGGGLMYELWMERIAELVHAMRAPIAVWGAGLNHGNPRVWNYSAHGYLWWASLLGMRDDDAPTLDYPFATWVPCASCMSSTFDDPEDATTDVVIYDNCHKPVPINASSAPRASNVDFGTIEDATKFLTQGRTIVTSSYHGAYWGTLLGRRVVVFPWVPKLTRFRHQPGVLRSRVGLRHVIADGVAHPEALAECRAANIDFYERVKRLTGGPR